MAPAHDAVNHPAHYNQLKGVECIDVIEGLGLGYHLGNCLKYLWRAGLKEGQPALLDLHKARWFLDRYIRRLEEKERRQEEEADAGRGTRVDVHS